MTSAFEANLKNAIEITVHVKSCGNTEHAHSLLRLSVSSLFSFNGSGSAAGNKNI